jgi:hypothetical protein
MIYDYNVWAEHKHSAVDFWTENEAEARDMARAYHQAHGLWPAITKYPTRTMPDGTYQTDTSTWEVV